MSPDGRMGAQRSSGTPRLLPSLHPDMKQVSLTKFGAGHAAFLEQPEAFIREFLNFITSLDKTAPQTNFAAPIKYQGEGYERSNSEYR
jgi:hypothetical protein